MVILKYRNMPHCTIQQCRTNTYIISLTALFTPLSHMQNPQLQVCQIPPPMPHMSLTDFVDFPPGHGRSVTDFSGWDAHEARLRCPDNVSGDIGGCRARRALKPNFN